MSLTNLNEVETTLLGVAAGLIEVSIMQPTIYLKNATQQQLPLTMDPKILYRGYAASASNMAVLTGLQFLFCGMAQKHFTGGKNRELSFMEANASGFFGGAASGPVCCVLELTMIQQQRFAGTFIGTPSRIIGEYGIKGMSRGLLGSSLREGLYTAGFLGMSPFICDFCTEKEIPGGKVLGPLISAITCGTLSHPVDTFKTCMQGDVEQKKYTNIKGTCQTIHAERGVRGFFAGWMWRCLLRQCPSFFILNESRLQLAPMMFPDKCN